MLELEGNLGRRPAETAGADQSAGNRAPGSNEEEAIELNPENLSAAATLAAVKLMAASGASPIDMYAHLQRDTGRAVNPTWRERGFTHVVVLYPMYAHFCLAQDPETTAVRNNFIASQGGPDNFGYEVVPSDGPRKEVYLFLKLPPG